MNDSQQWRPDGQTPQGMPQPPQWHASAPQTPPPGAQAGQSQYGAPQGHGFGPPPGQGHMPYGTPASQPHPGQWQQPASPRKRRAPRILMILGAVVCLLSLGAIGWGFVTGKDALPDPASLQAVTEPVTVTMQEGQEIALWARSGAEFSCSVTDMEGNPASTVPIGGNSFNNDAGEFRGLVQWSGPGEFIVSCDGEGGHLGQTMDVQRFVASVFAGVGGVIVFGIGLVLLIVGVVLTMMQRKQSVAEA